MTRRMLLCSLALAAVAGCGGSRPLHKGPDLANVPEGFIYEHTESARNLFPGRPKVLERSYVTRAIADDFHSTITITQYDGATTAQEVEEAVRAEERRYGYAQYGAIEPVTIDRHAGWAWTETQPGNRWSAGALTYRAVVSYPGATYLLEFYSSHKHFMNPDLMKATVASFTISR